MEQPTKPDKYDEYAVQSAFDTMMKAKEHESDPKMMSLIKAHAHKKSKAIKSIAGLRAKANEMAMEKSKAPQPKKVSKMEEVQEGE